MQKGGNESMSSAIIAKKYAKAFADITGVDERDKKKLESSFKSLKQLFMIKEAQAVLNSFVMPVSLKKSLLDHALQQGQASQELKSFVYTVMNAQRISLLPEIIESYGALVDAANNRAHAQLASFSSLDKDQKERIQKKLERLFGKKIHLTTTVDPSLLGGFVVRVEHVLIDLSLKFRLDSLTAAAAL